MKFFSFAQEDSDLLRQKSLARDLKASQWWKRKLAKGICHYCNEHFPPGELTMDHIVPVSRGGKSVKGNVVTACKKCNTKKEQKLPMEMEESDP